VLVSLRRGRRALLGVTLALLVASAAAMAVLYTPNAQDGTTRVYFGTDARAAAILAGAALALFMGPEARLRPAARRILDLLGAVALIGLGVAWACLDGQSALLYRGGLWLTELACLVLIACAAAPGSFIARILSVRPLTFVGSIGYGLYLWHWPIDCALKPSRVHLGYTALFALRLAATLVVSLASYRWLEMPIRVRGLPFGRPWLVVPAVFALAALSVVVGTHPRPGSPSERDLIASAAPHRSGDAVPLARPDLFQIMVLGDCEREFDSKEIRPDGVHYSVE